MYSHRQDAHKLRMALFRLRMLFRRPAAWAVVCILAAILFSWPFLDGMPRVIGPGFYAYIFLAWGLIIFLCFLIAVSLPRSRNEPPERPKD